jgi:transcriptional regulator with XRE-family HTH domain
MPECEKPLAQDAATRKAIRLTFTFLKEHGIDQNRVAERLGVGHQIVSMVKTGKRPASMRQIEVLSQLAQEAMQAEPLSQDAWIDASTVTQAWWHAITDQIAAVSTLHKHVSRQLIGLQHDTDLTPAELERIAMYAADAQRFYIGLCRLVELGKAWQVVASRLEKAWKSVQKEKYPDGPPRRSQEETRLRSHRITRTHT